MDGRIAATSASASDNLQAPTYLNLAWPGLSVKKSVWTPSTTNFLNAVLHSLRSKEDDGMYNFKLRYSTFPS